MRGFELYNYFPIDLGVSTLPQKAGCCVVAGPFPRTLFIGLSVL